MFIISGWPTGRSIRAIRNIFAPATLVTQWGTAHQAHLLRRASSVNRPQSSLNTTPGSKLSILTNSRARETAARAALRIRPRRRFLFCEFRLEANDGDVGGAGTRYGVDVRTTPIDASNLATLADFTTIAALSRARGADDGRRRRRDAS